MNYDDVLITIDPEDFRQSSWEEAFNVADKYGLLEKWPAHLEVTDMHPKAEPFELKVSEVREWARCICDERAELRKKHEDPEWIQDLGEAAQQLTVYVQNAKPAEKLPNRIQILNWRAYGDDELTFVEQKEVANGSTLPWKIAMWGTATDLQVLRTTAKRCATLKDMEKAGAVSFSEGPRFISPKKATAKNAVERVDLIGRDTLDVKPLKNRRYLFVFPPVAIGPFPSEKRFLSKRAGVEKKLNTCEPPHVIIGASRKFAVYTEDFLIVPTGQIGITSPTQNRPILKALALYLNSDFVAYHDFLNTTQAGIQKSISTLKALRGIPVPFTESSDLSAWNNLYEKILDQCRDRHDFNMPKLVQELNELTFHELKLSSRGRAAVHDLVHVRFGLTRGKRSSNALRQPTRDECEAYARMLRDELDGFINDSIRTRHRVQVLAGDASGLAAIQIVTGAEKLIDVEVIDADSTQAKIMRDVRGALIERRAQWLYFDRNLRVYDGPNTYLLKPFQRLHWTRTQAIADAREIIADSLTPERSIPARNAIL